MSVSILSPSKSSAVGLLIQSSSDGGIQAWFKGKFNWILLLISQNLGKLAFDKASAIEANGVEHLSILVISTVAPSPAATVEMAIARVVERGQERLYPFL